MKADSSSAADCQWEAAKPRPGAVDSTAPVDFKPHCREHREGKSGGGASASEVA
jgi:hypothetical protein